MTFTNTNSSLRTDAEFLAMIDEEHHHGTTPLAQLPIGLVSDFVLDYALGVSGCNYAHVKFLIERSSSYWYSITVLCTSAAVRQTQSSYKSSFS
jgi:hypothetical protein